MQQMRLSSADLARLRASVGVVGIALPLSARVGVHGGNGHGTSSVPRASCPCRRAWPGWPWHKRRRVRGVRSNLVPSDGNIPNAQSFPLVRTRKLGAVSCRLLANRPLSPLLNSFEDIGLKALLGRNAEEQTIGF